MGLLDQYLCGLAQAGGTKTVLVGARSRRKPERFCCAPAVATEFAVECGAAAGAGEVAVACFAGSHLASLRAEGGERKNVIRRKPNHAYGRRMAFPWIVDFGGVAWALLTTVCWMPQVLKTVREKETRALSLPATSALPSVSCSG